MLEKTAQTNAQASVDIIAENDKNIAKINLKDQNVATLEIKVASFWSTDILHGSGSFKGLEQPESSEVLH